MKRVLKVLLACTALFTIAGSLLGPVYAVFVENIGGDLLTAGSSYGVFMLVCGALLYVMSRYENKKQKYANYFIIGGYALTSIGFIGYLFISAPVHLFAVQAVLGVAGAINSPAYDGLYSKNLAKGKFVLQWGMWETTRYFAAGLGAIAGGAIAQFFGFRALFLTMAGISLLGLLAASLLLWKQRKNK